MLKGIIFDLDGVITDTAKYHYEAWKQLASEIGITINERINEKLKGVSRMDSLNVILEYGNKTEAYTDTEKSEMADKKNRLYLKLIQYMTPDDILPGITVLLKSIKAANLQIALASASKNGPAILDKLGLTTAFDAVVDPSALAKGKPDPEIFAMGAELLNIKPDEAIGVEDAIAGITSINDAGLFSVGVGDAKVLAGADFVVPDTTHLTLGAMTQAFDAA